MNYYMPYTEIPYIINTSAKQGLLSKIFKNGINWSSMLTNTQKTLNIINQSIPVIKQVRPVMTNAKTMFKLMSEFKKVDIEKNKQSKKNNIELNSNQVKNEYYEHNENKPVFFQ